MEKSPLSSILRVQALCTLAEGSDPQGPSPSDANSTPSSLLPQASLLDSS